MSVCLPLCGEKILPADENSLLTGPEEAGIARYICAWLARFGNHEALLFQNKSGQECSSRRDSIEYASISSKTGPFSVGSISSIGSKKIDFLFWDIARGSLFCHGHVFLWKYHLIKQVNCGRILNLLCRFYFTNQADTEYQVFNEKHLDENKFSTQKQCFIKWYFDKKSLSGEPHEILVVGKCV